MHELCGLTITEASRALHAKEFSCTELTQAYLDRIEALDPTINAYITITAERALNDARQLSNEMFEAKSRGPLHGIPIGLKDLYETAGIRTTGGSKIHENHIPQIDCTVAKKLRNAGTVLLGKLNTHEYAYGVTTNNPHYGATRNPWNLDHIPGGSSGGSGAAIAAGLATATMGTDTGGSVRMPASLCGAVGLKATYGRVSKAGVMPLSYLFDHAGPITRSVADAGLILNAISGYDPLDPSSVRTPVADYSVKSTQDLRGLRIGVPRGYFFDQLDTEVAVAIDNAIASLSALGADVINIDISGMDEAVASLSAVGLAEAQEIHANALRDRAEDFGADVQQILSLPSPDSTNVIQALRTRDASAIAIAQAFEKVDLLVTPSTPIVAAKIGQESVSYGTVVEPIMMAMIRCTAPFNVSGHPALSLPCGFTSLGLPIGLQIVGQMFDEVTVLRAGNAYEQAAQWYKRTPQL